MEIRPALSGDLRGVQKCARAAYEMYVERIGKRPAPMVADFDAQIREGKLSVLADGKAICGFVVCFRREEHLHLENVAVLPELQGLGYGVRLIKFAEAKAVEQGLAAVELYTNAKMTENLRLYPYLGYSETGRWHEDGFDRVFFQKKL